MIQLQPNHEVTSVLSNIILNSKDYWKVLPNKGVTLGDVKSIPVPETNQNKGSVLPFQLPHGDYVEKASALLGGNLNTNCIVYPPNSSMEWHTNSDREGIRTYYTFTVKAGCFIYIHPETGEMIVDEDQVGWTVRQFEIRKDKPLWHCVWANGVRFSFGFTQPFEEAL